MNASVDMLGVLRNGSSPLSSSMGSMGGMQSSDDGSKKIRKPYTITKARESWTEQEHEKFLEALQLFDRDWKKIEAFVGSKTVIQIRSHAQKYFLKVQKNGTGEHVPPPRPKRKSAQPYPQKAPKTVAQAGVMGRTLNPQPTQSEPCFPRRGNFQSSSMGSNSGSWQHHSMPPVGQATPDLRGDIAVTAVKPAPDFAEVYKFIGNVFDPGSSSHLKRLKEMAPIDRETVMLLMRNLYINLNHPDFEEHKQSLLACDVNPIDSRPAGSEHQISIPSIPSATQARSDGADASSAASCQPNHLSESADSDSHWDVNHRTRGMPSFSEGAMEAPQLRRQPYFDGGSRSVSPINPYPPLISSRPVLDIPSVGMHRTMAPHSHPHMAAFGGGRGFAMPLPALTAGVEGNLDGWWG